MATVAVILLFLCLRSVVVKGKIYLCFQTLLREFCKDCPLVYLYRRDINIKRRVYPH